LEIEHGIEAFFDPIFGGAIYPIYNGTESQSPVILHKARSRKCQKYDDLPVKGHQHQDVLHDEEKFGSKEEKILLIIREVFI